MYEKRGLLDEDLWNEPVEYIQQQHQDYPSSYHQPREYPARERIMMDYDAPRPSSGRYVPTRYERMMMLEQEAADEAAEREMMMYRRRSRSVGRSAIYPPVMMSRGNLASSDYDEEYPARYTPSSQAALRRRSQSVGAINRIQPSLPPHHLQQQYYEDDVPVPAQRRLYSQHTPSRYEHLQQQQQLQRDPSIYQRRDKRRSSIPIIASNYAASPEVDEEEQHEFNSRAQSLGRVGGATSTSRRSSIKPVGANIRNQSYEEHLELQQQEAPRRKSSTTTTRKLAAQTKKQATQSSATRKSASASLSSSSFASSSSAKAVYIDNQDEEIFGVVDEIHQQQQDDDEVDDDVLSAVNEDSFDEVDRVEYVDEDVSFTRHPKQSGGVAQEDQVLAPPSSLLAAATSLSSSFSSSTSIGRKSMDKQQDIYDFPDVDNDDDQIVNDLGHVSDGSGVFDDAAPQMEEFNSNNSLVHGNDDDEAGGNEEEGLAAVVAPKRRGRKPGIKTKSTASRKKKNAPAPKYVEYTEDYDDEQNSQDEAERAQLMTQRALLKKKQIQDGSMVTVGKFEQPGNIYFKTFYVLYLLLFQQKLFPMMMTAPEEVDVLEPSQFSGGKRKRS